MNHPEIDEVRELEDAVTDILQRGQFMLDPRGPYSGMGQVIARTLWDMGYRKQFAGIEYRLLWENEAVELVLCSATSSMLEIYEKMYQFEVKQQARPVGDPGELWVLFRRDGSMWDELDRYWWEDQYDDYTTDKEGKSK